MINKFVHFFLLSLLIVIYSCKNEPDSKKIIGEWHFSNFSTDMYKGTSCDTFNFFILGDNSLTVVNPTAMTSIKKVTDSIYAFYRLDMEGTESQLGKKHIERINILKIYQNIIITGFCLNQNEQLKDNKGSVIISDSNLTFIEKRADYFGNIESDTFDYHYNYLIETSKLIVRVPTSKKFIEFRNIEFKIDTLTTSKLVLSNDYYAGYKFQLVFSKK